MKKKNHRVNYALLSHEFKHTFRIMKLTSVFITICISSLFAVEVHSQSAKVSVFANNLQAKEVIDQIESQTDYLFVYNNNQVDLSRKVSVDAKNLPIFEVLSKVFDQTKVAYIVEGNNILLMRKPEGKETQQRKTVTGTILDINGDAIIGVNVIVKGAIGVGAITDIDGNFSLQVTESVVLLISYIGYTDMEIQTKGKTKFNLVLKEDTQALDELVVIGYGTQKKANLTGSVEVVGADELKNRPVTSASALLQGQVVGMTFSTPSGGNAPGKTPIIQIRGQAALSGSTPPLVVIDGIPSDMNSFNSLNPNDIENVSVLKDAAASAIYGARAPYGVLMVTTKMGRRDEKAKITYSGNYALVKPVRMPSMADSYTFALSKNQAALNGRGTAPFSEDHLDIIQGNVLNPGKYTTEQLHPVLDDSQWGLSSYNNDFIDIWIKPSFRHQHDLSIRGGGETSSYFVSTAYVYQPGNLNFVEKEDNYSRFNINGGVEADISDWINVTYRSRYSYSDAKEPLVEHNGGRDRLYSFAYGAWPTGAIKNPDGTYSDGSRINTAINGGSKTRMQHRLDNILALDFNLAKGWTAHVDGSWRMSFYDNEDLGKPVYGAFPSGDLYQIGGTSSSLSKSTEVNQYWTIQGYSAYETTLKKHNIRIQVGAQGEENNYRKLSGNTTDLIVTDLPSIAISQGTRTLNDAMNDWATVGVFGRLNYNFDERYLLELNGRYDGSGRYSSNSRWGFFPSASAGWNLSNEKFWERIEPIVNYSKIKVSYGTLGNQGNSAGYLHVPTMSVGSQSDWIFNDGRLPYVKTPGILNMNRTWEKITTLNLALNLRFLENRLSTDFEYYNRRSWDIIGPATPKSGVLGVAAPAVNNTEFVTKGFELMVQWMDMITPNWSYKVGVNLADGKSEITEYLTTVNAIGDSKKYYVGKEFGEIWGYQSTGLLNESDFAEDGKLHVSQSKICATWYPGDVKYEDLNGDGEITKGNSTVENSGDLRKIGNSTPRYRYGINLGTSYEFEKAGRLDLSLFFEGVAKRDMFMGNSYFFFGAPPAGWESSAARSVYQGKQLDFYRDDTTEPRLLEHLGTNTDSYFPRPYDSSEGNKNFKTSTKYLLNGAYMRLKNLQVSYALPSDWLQNLKISNCRLYFSGENLFVISALPDYIDPEQVSGGRMYPQQAVYSFGVNIEL